MGLSDFLWGVVAGGGPSLVLAGTILWWLRQRRMRSRRPAEDPGRGGLTHAPGTVGATVKLMPPPLANPFDLRAPAPPEPAPSASVEPPPSPPPTPAGSEGRERVARVADRRPGAEPLPERPARPLPPTDAIALPPRIPYRILLHVARQGRAGPDEVPSRALSQAGMVEALGVRQGAVAAALQRLVSAQLLEVQRSHVRGGDRRLKVYRLTSRGEELVRDLRRRGRSRESPARPSPPSHEGS